MVHKNKKNLAFSIIELLIVITIIGILAAIAGPMYTDYVLKSRITKAVALKDRMYKTLVNTYSLHSKFYEGSAGSEYIDVNGQNIRVTTSGNDSYTAYPVYNKEFVDSIAIRVENEVKVHLCFRLTGLDGMPNYVGGSSSTTSRYFCEIITIEGGGFHRRCGVQNSNPATDWDIAVKYMPKGCTCTNRYSSDAGCT